MGKIPVLHSFILRRVCVLGGDRDRNTEREMVKQQERQRVRISVLQKIKQYKKKIGGYISQQRKGPFFKNSRSRDTVPGSTIIHVL